MLHLSNSSVNIVYNTEASLIPLGITLLLRFLLSDDVRWVAEAEIADMKQPVLQR